MSSEKIGYLISSIPAMNKTEIFDPEYGKNGVTFFMTEGGITKLLLAFKTNFSVFNDFAFCNNSSTIPPSNVVINK